MNTLKYECNLQNNLYFHWMQLINAIYLIGKLSLNKIMIAMRLQHQSIILFKTQESLRFKK